MDLIETRTDVTKTRVLPSAVGREFETLAASPALQMEAIHDFISGQDFSVWLTKAMEEIVSTPRSLEELGAYSYEHPNGFDQLPLELRSPHYRARIHVWWPERTDVIEDIHNHAWDFASRILCGSLRFITFEIGDGGTPHYHYPNYPNRFDGDVTPKQADDRMVNLRKTFDGRLAPGTCYSFSNTELHRVIAEGAGRPVVTFVITGVRQRGGSDVYAEKRRSERYRLMEPLGPDHLRRRLERLLEELSPDLSAKA